jgi:L-2-hydroxyglutarate oxidase LhgO
VTNDSTYDHCVIGAGIVGLAVARQLLLSRPGASVLVVDKESTVAAHQTGHNSGVIHAGIYYAPGSVKSTLCRRGVGLLQSLCDEFGVPYDVCGKVIVAVDEAEEPALERLYQRATDAGVPGARRIGPAELRDLEPHAVGRAALVSPTTAIVDFRAVAEALAADVTGRGGRIVLGAAVTGIADRTDKVAVTTGKGTFEAGDAVICGGLQTDALAELAGSPSDPRIVPFRGEYYRLRPDRSHLVRSLLYPVPDPRYPFLGVHFTKMIDGGVTVGPNAVLALAYEGYRWRDVRPRDLARDRLDEPPGVRQPGPPLRARAPHLRPGDGRRRSPRPGSRPRRCPPRRLRLLPFRAGPRRAQRTLAGGDRLARHRRARRRGAPGGRLTVSRRATHRRRRAPGR